MCQMANKTKKKKKYFAHKKIDKVKSSICYMKFKYYNAAFKIGNGVRSCCFFFLLLLYTLFVLHLLSSPGRFEIEWLFFFGQFQNITLSRASSIVYSCVFCCCCCCVVCFFFALFSVGCVVISIIKSRILDGANGFYSIWFGLVLTGFGNGSQSFLLLPHCIISNWITTAPTTTNRILSDACSFSLSLSHSHVQLVRLLPRFYYYYFFFVTFLFDHFRIEFYKKFSEQKTTKIYDKARQKKNGAAA